MKNTKKNVLCAALVIFAYASSPSAFARHDHHDHDHHHHMSSSSNTNVPGEHDLDVTGGGNYGANSNDPGGFGVPNGSGAPID